MPLLPMDDLPDFVQANHRYRVIERTAHSFTRKVAIMGVLFVVLLLAIFPMLFGWRWTLALVPMLVVGALALKAASMIGRRAVIGHDRRDIGETVYGFAGHELRTFSDRVGQVWIRAHDIRRALDLDRSDGWMARAYPKGFRRANAKVPAYYIQPEVVRRHWRGSHQMTVNRFLSWMERELVPLQQKRNAIEPYAHPPEKAAKAGSSSGERQPVRWRAMLHAIPRYGCAHWRGEHGLLQSAFLGGVIACLAGALLIVEPSPTNVVHHYRAIAISLIVWLSALGLTALWWGVGVWRSAPRWIEAGERFVGEQARFGLHRSGVNWREADEGLSETDREMQRFLLGQGVAPGFVEKGLKPSIFDIWEPSVEEVLVSGLGTRN